MYYIPLCSTLKIIFKTVLFHPSFGTKRKSFLDRGNLGYRQDITTVRVDNLLERQVPAPSGSIINPGLMIAEVRESVRGRRRGERVTVSEWRRGTEEVSTLLWKASRNAGWQVNPWGLTGLYPAVSESSSGTSRAYMSSSRKDRRIPTYGRTCTAVARPPH